MKTIKKYPTWRTNYYTNFLYKVYFNSLLRPSSWETGSRYHRTTAMIILLFHKEVIGIHSICVEKFHFTWMMRKIYASGMYRAKSLAWVYNYIYIWLVRIFAPKVMTVRSLGLWRSHNKPTTIFQSSSSRKVDKHIHFGPFSRLEKYHKYLSTNTAVHRHRSKGCQYTAGTAGLLSHSLKY